MFSAGPPSEEDVDLEITARKAPAIQENSLPWWIFACNVCHRLAIHTSLSFQGTGLEGPTRGVNHHCNQPELKPTKD